MPAVEDTQVNSKKREKREKREKKTINVYSALSTPLANVDYVHNHD